MSRTACQRRAYKAAKTRAKRAELALALLVQGRGGQAVDNEPFAGVEFYVSAGGALGFQTSSTPNSMKDNGRSLHRRGSDRP